MSSIHLAYKVINGQELAVTLPQAYFDAKKVIALISGGFSHTHVLRT